MAIEFFAEDVEMPDFELAELEHVLCFIIRNEAYEPGNLDIVFCSDEYLLKINRTYLNHDFYTDIVTFDYVEGEIVSGDLFISLDRIKENAEQFADDFLQELFRVSIHGVLHLCGYDDATESEKTTMRAKENQYLKKAGKLN